MGEKPGTASHFQKQEMVAVPIFLWAAIFRRGTDVHAANYALGHWCLSPKFQEGGELVGVVGDDGGLVAVGGVDSRELVGVIAEDVVGVFQQVPG